MREIKSMPVDYNTAVKYHGTHRDVRWEVACHGFRKEDELSYHLPACYWATYICMTEEMHERFKPHLERAPWNCGQTYYRKETQEHIGVSGELAAKWNKPFYKMGDDFSHLWDMDRQDLYNREYLEGHIKNVIDYLVDATRATESEGAE